MIVYNKVMNHINQNPIIYRLLCSCFSVYHRLINTINKHNNHTLLANTYPFCGIDNHIVQSTRILTIQLNTNHRNSCESCFFHHHSQSVKRHCIPRTVIIRIITTKIRDNIFHANSDCNTNHRHKLVTIVNNVFLYAYKTS